MQIPFYYEQEETWYRVSINFKLREIYFLEIACFDERFGMVMKNPTLSEKVKDEVVKSIFQILETENLENKLVLTTLNSAFNHVLRTIKKQRISNVQKKTKRKIKRGRPRENYLNNAVLWVIQNKQEGETKTDVAKRAYEHFQPKIPTQETFIHGVLRRGQEIANNWKKSSEVSEYEFAKRFLKHRVS